MHANAIAFGSYNARHMCTMGDLLPVCGHVYHVRLAGKFRVVDAHRRVDYAHSLSKARVALSIGLGSIDDVQSSACLVLICFESICWRSLDRLDRQEREEKDDKASVRMGISFVVRERGRREKARARGRGLCVVGNSKLSEHGSLWQVFFEVLFAHNLAYFHKITVHTKRGEQTFCLLPSCILYAVAYLPVSCVRPASCTTSFPAFKSSPMCFCTSSHSAFEGLGMSR